MSLVKYRIREVAKDLGMPPKAVMELFAQRFGPAKNHMQVLEENQLNVLFDVITQQHQVEDMKRALDEAKSAPKQPEKAPEKTADAGKPEKQEKPAAKAGTQASKPEPQE